MGRTIPQIRGMGLILVLSLLLVAGVACGSREVPVRVERPVVVEKPVEMEAVVVPSSEDDSAAPVGDVEAVPAATPAQAARPERVLHPRGGKLVRLFSDPPTLDPHLATDNISGTIANEVFGGLVTINPKIELTPDLAESWDISPNGLVYTFRLRQDAKFHDGKPVTAEDIRWSLERAADPATESPIAEQYLGDMVGVPAKLRGEAQTIQGLRVVDDYTVELTIDAPKPYFLAKLTYPTGFVVDRANVEANPRKWVFEPNGTGPFRLSRYDVGEIMILSRNEFYHLGPPFLDEVEFILSGGDAMLMYENDEIHLTGLGLADLERLQDPANPMNAELITAPPSFSVSYIGMNVNIPPFDDPKVRQAFNYAVDKQSIATKILADLQVPAKGVIPPGFPSYNSALEGYEFDPKKAKRLLQESKYGNDLENLPHITLSISGSFGANVGLDMESMLQMWQENLGIQVQIQQIEWATFLEDLHGRRFQMFNVAWGADYPDPENFLDILFHSESRNNHMAYSSPEVDALLEQARVEQDQTTRYNLYNRIEQMVVDDAPWISLWHSSERKVLIKPEVKDYFLTPMAIPKLRFVYFEQN